METKPFSLQAPEQIAKEYAGNKQKIAQAAQMGLLDPTAAVLAGMFIDRMRSAQTQEAQPPQTVAQQVFAPPAPQAPPAGGLGALPQDGAPAMPPATPPMPAAEGLASMAPAMPPMGGEEVAAMAEGGLAGLEIPDDMFMETDNYAGGGMVAFADAGIVRKPGYAGMTDEEIIESIPELKAMPVQDAMAAIQQYIGQPGGKYRERYTADLERRMSPEYEAQQKKGDLNEFLMRLGFGMASGQSPNFLQNLSAAAAPAGEAAIKAVKEREKEQREALKDAVNAELEDYGLKVKSFDAAMSYKNTVDNLMAKGVDAATAKAKAVLDLRQGNRTIAASLAVGLKPTDKENRVRRIAAQYMEDDPSITPKQAYAMAEREAGIYDNPMATARIGMQVETTIQKAMDDWDKANNKYTTYRDVVAAAPEGKNPLDAAQTKEFNRLKQLRAAHEKTLRKRYESFLGNVNSVEAAPRASAEGFDEGQTAKDVQGRTIVFQGGQWVYP